MRLILILILTTTVAAEVFIDKVEFTSGDRHDSNVHEGELATHIEPGDEATIEVQLVNEGNFVSAAGVTLDVRFNDNEPLRASTSFIALKPGQRRSLDISFLVPYLLEERTHELLLTLFADEQETTFSFLVDVEKQGTAAVFSDIRYPNLLRCTSSTSIYIEIVNVGQRAIHDATLIVGSTTRYITIPAGSKEDAVYRTTVPITLPSEGTLTVPLTLAYGPEELSRLEELRVLPCSAPREEVIVTLLPPRTSSPPGKDVTFLVTGVILVLFLIGIVSGFALRRF